jgi:lactoylglutathione lyase
MIDRIREMSYIILLCDDKVAMEQFYTEVMKFRIYRQEPNWTELQVGSTLLTLRSRGRDYDGVGTSGASVQLAFRVAPDEVRDIESYLVDKEVDIIEPTTDKDFGHRTLFFRDPEGNILEIYAEIALPQNDSLLSKLTFENVLEISEHCELKIYQDGESIVRQGDLADKFYVITKGHVKVVNTLDDGKEILVGYLHAGDYFGEVGLLQSHPRTATIRASDAMGVHVIAIDRDGFSELLEDSEVASADISQAMYDRLMGMAEAIIRSTDI